MFSSRFRRAGRGRLGLHLRLQFLEERVDPAQLVVTSAADDGSAGTLRAVAEIANSNGEPDTITFDSGISDITLVQGQVRFFGNPSLTIHGPGSSKLVIRNQSPEPLINRIFDFPSSGSKPHSVTVTGLTLADTIASVPGTAIRGSVLNLTLEDVVVRDNVGINFNSPISISGHENHVVVINCHFLRNSGNGNSGAIELLAPSSSSPESSLSISASSFVENVGASRGGAVYASGRTSLGISSSVFRGNQSSVAGAVNTLADPFPSIINGCLFEDNQGKYGGGLRARNGPVTISDSTFRNNESELGGALNVWNPDSLLIERSSFDSNTAWQAGGIYIDAVTTSTPPPVLIRQTTIANNFAIDPTVGGGGIEIHTGNSSFGNANIAIENSTITGNQTRGVQGGGGIWISGSAWKGQLTIRNSTIVENKAPAGLGGGIGANTAGGIMTLSSTIAAGNSALVGNDIRFAVTRNVVGDNNLIGSLTDSNVQMTGINDANLLGSDSSPINPGVAGLANYGGLASTRPLTYASVALDRGNNNDGLLEDQRGLPRTLGVQTDVGATEGLISLPFVAGTTIGDVLAGTVGAYKFSVIYDDETGIDISSLNSSNVIINGPRAVGPVSFLGFSMAGNRVTANYEFMPFDGGWNEFDNGLYTIQSGTAKVRDNDPVANELPAQEIGRMRINIVGNYVVDTAGDVIDGKYGPGELSIREAIDLANSSLGNIDTVSFDSSLAGKTIQLSGTPLIVQDPVAIRGLGVGQTTISGNSNSSILQFRVAGIGSPSIVSDMSLVDGVYAVNVLGSKLTLANSAITGSIGFGVGSGYTSFVNILDSVVSDSNGRGLSFAANATVTIERSSIVSSKGSSGRGIDFAGSTLTIVDSTIANNQNTDAVIGSGAGLFLSGGLTTIRNSTISGNSTWTNNGAGGIVIQGNANCQISNSTIVNNSSKGSNGVGGIDLRNGQLSIVSTIIANTANEQPSDIETTNTSGPILSVIAEHSLISADTDPGIAISGSTNLIGQVNSPIDPQLGPLQNNGGATATHALLPGSPAINAGSNPNDLTNDQRGFGFQRVYGTAADIGSYEALVPSIVSGLLINDGAIQRSQVTSLAVNFDRPVTLPAIPADAFQLRRQSDSAIVELAPVVIGEVVTLNFTDGPLDFGSLADGRYTLTVFASKVNGGYFDGNGDGIPGDNFTFSFHRLFGDADGNGSVTAADFNAFRLAYGISGPSIFDFDNSGTVSAADFNAFRLRYGVTLMP